MAARQNTSTGAECSDQSQHKAAVCWILKSAEYHDSGTMEKQNKTSKNVYAPSTQAMPLWLDWPYIQWLDHVDAVLSYRLLLGRIY